jgi:hypothetical protein
MMNLFRITKQSKDEVPSICTCSKLPFNFMHFKTVALGEDSFGAEITINTCKKCGLAWLKYLIEEPHYSRSGRWWMTALPTQGSSGLSVANARQYIERQAECFAGGSYFKSTGHHISAPIKIG